MATSKRAKLDHMHQCDNFINGKCEAPPSGEYLDVESPCTGETIGQVALSTSNDVQKAVDCAQKAFVSWSGMTMKARAAIMFKFHTLMRDHADELADLVVQENGKNKAEALASVAKGNETVEWACSIPQLAQGKVLQVSRGIMCQDLREPLGIVASIVPFNFPAMVPMWTVPIALTCGNCVILKPSEKVPITMTRIAQLLHQAGVPPGVFQVIQGQVECVNAICDHPEIRAVSFVGSSKVAEIVAKRCRALNKRVVALGGAKNHLVALPDADPEMAASDIVASFAGCAGQRCMAASVLLLVGDCQTILDKIVEKSKALVRGTDPGQVGAIIDKASKDRILGYIDESDKAGASVLVDGRSWAKIQPGNWVGPTVLLHTNPADRALHDEIFGPVLSVLRVNSFDEALQIENACPYGNAASVYTTIGAHADYFQTRFRAAMIGVNIGVPVPREPFSFGGMYGTTSKFGDMDITGDGCLEFFTNRRKITSKWGYVCGRASNTTTAPKNSGDSKDTANFAGQL